MKERVIVSLSSGTIVKALCWFVVFAGLLYVSDFIIVLFVAVVLASAAELPVRRLMRFGLSRGLAVFSIFLTLVGVIAAVALIFIPPLADDAARFIQTLPQILNSVQIFGRDMGFKDLAAAVSELSRDISKGQILTILKNIVLGAGGFVATTSLVIGGIINIVLTFVLAFYLALEERGVQKFLRLLTPRAHEAYIEDLWTRVQTKISLWMQGQLLLSLLVSFLVYVPMLILSVPYASLLAVLAFVGELIPMVGLTLSLIPALFLSWTFGGTSLLIIVAVIYVVIAQLESHVLYPRIMNKLVGVPSVIVVIGLIVGAKLAGIWGVLLSVPVAAILMELAGDLEKKKSNESE